MKRQMTEQEQKHKSKEEKQSQEIKRLKRKSRRLDAIILIGLFQIGSLALSYYLGHSSHRNKN